MGLLSVHRTYLGRVLLIDAHCPPANRGRADSDPRSDARSPHQRSQPNSSRFVLSSSPPRLRPRDCLGLLDDQEGRNSSPQGSMGKANIACSPPQEDSFIKGTTTGEFVEDAFGL